MLTGLLFVLQAMASTEERAYEIMRELDVSYVLVIFGGLTGYSSDGASQVSVDQSQCDLSVHVYRHIPLQIKALHS